MRLFAAIDLSAETREALATEQRRLKSILGRAGATLKWVRPDDAHLTLVFLGHVADERVPALAADFLRDIHRPPFEMAISGIGVFPGRGAPRVVWAGVTAGGDAVVSLQREVAARLGAHGVALEAREFHPHLTLARWTDARPSDRARALAAGRSSVLARQAVAGVTLYESRLAPSGARYTALARANLTGA